jgi:hypothetical protein
VANELAESANVNFPECRNYRSSPNKALVRRCLVWPALSAAVASLLACSALLPKGEGLVQSPWQSYQEAQQTLDKVVPHVTTTADIGQLRLDPASNPNITILNYSDILRRFVPSPSINANDLDRDILECIRARSACKGYEVNVRVTKRNRYGNLFLDFLNFRRKVDIVGWSFNAVILIKDDIVIYKLTGGQPAIHEHEESTNPLGPLQGIGESNLISR